jgi:uncharacterized protein YhaN
MPRPMNAPIPPHLAKHPRTGSAGGILLVVLGTAVVIAIILVMQHRSLKQPKPSAPSAAPAAEADAAATSAGPSAAPVNQVQAALDKATAANLVLQADLDKEKAEARDLQSKLTQATAASDQLRIQLDAANADGADLKARLEKAKDQTNSVRSELAAAQSEKAGLAGDLDREKTEAADLKAKLQKSEAYAAGIQPLVARARHLPIRISSDKVMGNPFELVSGHSSYTIHLANLSLEPVNVDLTIVTAGHTIAQSNTIGGGATLNLERLAEGAKVTIAADTYESVTTGVP